MDTSMLAKTAFTETGSNEVLAWINKGQRLLAPDHVTVEMIAVAHKKVRDGFIPSSDAMPLVHRALKMLEEERPILPLAEAALTLAIRVRASLYDSLFLALAVERAIPLVTADMKLVERVRAHAPEIDCLTLADL